jgi:hypothetical protein
MGTVVIRASNGQKRRWDTSCEAKGVLLASMRIGYLSDRTRTAHLNVHVGFNVSSCG